MNSAPSFRWLGHSSVLVSGPNSPTVVVDPWRWRLKDVTADLVLITHGHADHCSEDDVAAASHERTVVVGPHSLAKRFPVRFRGVAEGDEFSNVGARISALPAEGPRRAIGFHPRGHGVSYVVDVPGVSYLFLGDSVALPEHARVDPDVAFFAIGGLAVMTPEEAAESAAAIKPALAVPVHWGDLNGRFDVAAKFVARCAELGVRAESVAGRL